MTPLVPSRRPVLSQEEAYIINQLVAGVTRKAIARQLDISVRQLHRRIDDLRAKLGARNDMQAALLAYLAGVIDLSSIESTDQVLPFLWLPARHAEQTHILTATKCEGGQSNR